MFETLKRLFDESKLTIVKLRNAVVKDWITEVQFKEITGEDYIA